MRIAVFGGSSPQAGDPVYEDALLLGKMLGKAGHKVLNGGYTGTMEAVSRGASKAGAHVIGVTCREIESWRKSRANKWVNEEWPCETLEERIRVMIDNCDAAIALPGGVGTLTEIMSYWNRLVIHSIVRHPLIVIGSGWKEVLDSFIKTQGAYLAPDDTYWIKFAENSREALDLLQKDTEQP
jgi:uncharacterized protein (TIGR00730 family)